MSDLRPLQEVGPLRRWPAEWEPQRRLWVGCPRLPDEWGDAFDAARREIADFIDVARSSIDVAVAVGDAESLRAAQSMLPSGVSCVRVPTGDIWLRDTGPVFVEVGDAEPPNGLHASCFAFNGWGGKFDMAGDRETACAIAGIEADTAQPFGFILEGGAVETDGTGRILTTRECLLNSNRNGWTQAAAETALGEALGAREVLWIDRGLIGDHTDGHVDNIARFVRPGHVVCQTARGPDDPQAKRLAEIEVQLRAMDLTVSTIPSPGRVSGLESHPLPASHLNFTITPTQIIVPVYERGVGAEAVAALAPLFPTRSVIGLPAGAILAGGGAFHCMTCHVPALSGRDQA